MQPTSIMRGTLPQPGEAYADFMDFPVPLALADASGRIQLVNRPFQSRYGAAMPTADEVRRAAEGAREGWRRAVVHMSSADQPGTPVRVIAGLRHILLVVDPVGDEQVSSELIALRQRIANLEQLAATDHLTGAWNRAHLDRIVDAEVARSLQSRLPLSLVLVDIDHFKHINDTWGHATGDVVLRTLVQVMRARIRPSDLLFRWGGEEFVVLVSAAGYRQAGTIAEALRNAVEQHEFPEVGKVTISAGVAEHVGEESPADWFKRVDAALYEAKEGGRNRVVVARAGNSDRWASDGGAASLQLAWSEAYESGEPRIDAEHRELFGHANVLLRSALEIGADANRLEAPLATLLDAVRAHFADEELILQERMYDRLSEHRQAHAGLLRRAEALRQRVAAGEAGIGAIVEYVAPDVVAHHILTTDRAYFPLFAQPPRGAAPA